jgi:hypothetical protein
MGIVIIQQHIASAVVEGAEAMTLSLTLALLLAPNLTTNVSAISPMGS